MVRDIILTNSTIAGRFKTHSFYEITPKVKSQSFRGYPFMIIHIPSTSEESHLGNLRYDQEFTIIIEMFIEYDARSRVSEYSSQLLTTLRAAEDTFRNSGFSLSRVNLVVEPQVTTLNQKDVVVTEFELILKGEVAV